LINLYIELRDGLRDLEERFYTMIPMYHRDYTNSPEDFTHETTYKQYCRATDEREKAKDAKYTLENMIYPHFDIDDIDHVEEGDMEWMNAGRRRAGGYQVSYEEADQESGETRSQMEEKSQLLIEYYTPYFNL